MNKFTPGPWNIRRIGKSRTIVEIGPICADEYAGSCWIDVSESDASIACAAPDLLEALESTTECAEILRGLIESIEKHGNYSAESTINFLNQALGCHYLSPAAIARARGAE